MDEFAIHKRIAHNFNIELHELGSAEQCPLRCNLNHFAAIDSNQKLVNVDVIVLSMVNFYRIVLVSQQ